MTAPAFWSTPPERPGWLARALAPAAWVWRLGAMLRAARARPYRADVPVICVGNLTAGGAGKTPMVAALADRLTARGLTPHILSRGYGGREAGPHRVALGRDTAADVGDEALLHAAIAPAWVARDRAAGAREAASAGAGLILLDDGMQNPHLIKDLTILVVDAEAGFGNGRMIPAGPLREPVSEGLARAGAVVLIGAPEARKAARARWPELGAARTVGAALRPAETGLAFAGLPVVAFAGIGRPEKFFATLRSLGADLRGAHPFADHAPLTARQFARLQSEARRAGAMLVTTEKDAVRLPTDLRREVVTLTVRLEIDDWSAIDAATDGALACARAGPPKAR